MEVNARIQHILGILNIPCKDTYTHIRISWEGDDKANLYVLRRGKFEMLERIELDVLASLLSLLVFEEPGKVMAGLDSTEELAILRDCDNGRLTSVCLDFPSDYATLHYETGGMFLSFGEFHSDIIRETFWLE